MFGKSRFELNNASETCKGDILIKNSIIGYWMYMQLQQSEGERGRGGWREGKGGRGRKEKTKEREMEATISGRRL